MNAGNPIGNQRTSVRWATPTNRLPTLIKEPWVVLQYAGERWRCGKQGLTSGASVEECAESINVCLCLMLDQCYIIKIPLSIRAEKVKWPSALKLHQTIQTPLNTHKHTHLALKHKFECVFTGPCQEHTYDSQRNETGGS